MKPCRGCTACYRTGRCAISDDGIETLVEEVKASDDLVVGTPTYGSNVPGQLKTFMDRGHFIMEQGLYGKHALSLATYEIAEGNQAAAVIDKFLLVSGAARRGRVVIRCAANVDPLQTPKTMALLHRRLDGLVAAIARTKGRSLFERLVKDLLVVRGLWRSHFRRHPDRFAGVLQHYREHGIHRACWQVQG